MEDAYFHQSHLKGKQDYGHQAAVVMLSCNGIVLNYVIVMYDKSKLKVKTVQEIADGCLYRQWPLISFVTAGIHAAASWSFLSKRASILSAC